MARIIIFNKPYGVLSQFTAQGRWRSLADFLSIPGVYPAGRLDADSEGLLLLTDDGALQHRIAEPKHKLEKIYWAQVEGVPDAHAIQCLQKGVCLTDYVTQPCRAWLIDPPESLWTREPPIRFRQNIPTTWMALGLREGKNRQVRKMCAAVGFPVLRLVRTSIGAITLEGLQPGTWREIKGTHQILLAALGVGNVP